MTILSRSATAVGAAVSAVSALALAVPLASASPQRNPFPVRAPKLHRPMHWFHWHPAGASLQERAQRFGSTAVVGLESMGDLDPLRRHYGFEHVRRIPSLRAVGPTV